MEEYRGKIAFQRAIELGAESASLEKIIHQSSEEISDKNDIFLVLSGDIVIMGDDTKHEVMLEISDEISTFPKEQK